VVLRVFYRKKPDDVRTDKTGAAGDEDGHIFMFDGLGGLGGLMVWEV
jgi:hypothetical protein